MSGKRQYTGMWIIFVALAIMGIIIAIIMLRAEEEGTAPSTIESPVEQLDDTTPPASGPGDELAP